MTREQYQSIHVNNLRELAKSRGVKRTSTMKKRELIDAMLALDSENGADGGAAETGAASAAGAGVPGAAGAAETGVSGAAGAGIAGAAGAAGTGVSGPAKAGVPGAVGAAGAAGAGATDVAEAGTAEAEAAGNGSREAGAGETSMAGAEAAGVRGRRPGRRPLRENPENTADEEESHTVQTVRRGRPRENYNGSAAREQSAGRMGRIPYNNGRNTREYQNQERDNRRENHTYENRRDGHTYDNRRDTRTSEIRENNGYETRRDTRTSEIRENNGYDNRRDARTPEIRENNGYDNRRDTRPPYRHEPADDLTAAVQSAADAELEAPAAHTSPMSEGGNVVRGILEVMQDGFGFLRSDNFLPGEDDIYVSPSQIRRFNLKTGDMITGNKRDRAQGEKYGALLYVSRVNDFPADEARRRPAFESMTPIFPNERIRLERPDGSRATRIVDLISPIGKGQRGMIVSPPKAGKTTLLKDIAKSILTQNPDQHLIILLIDERPEEVTDMKESVFGKNVEIIYSTFDELPEHHRRVSEMVIERAKRLVEHHEDVIILLDSITRLTRAYNILVPQSGRTLSGGLDPTALYMPKRFFGAARNMREGGSLTILATALVDTGSKMDDVVYEEFKGTGNMELILDRKLQERRIFPAIDIVKSGTRREDLLLSPREFRAVDLMRRRMNGLKAEEAVEHILQAFTHYPSNEMVVTAILTKWAPDRSSGS